MRNLFQWWHGLRQGREALIQHAVDKHRDRARDLIDMLYKRGPMVGMTRVEHVFNDYYPQRRLPGGTWRVIVEQVEPPPTGTVVPLRVPRKD